MNQNYFENKFLLSVVGGVIRQDDLFPVRRQLNWERLYHLADYHHVAGVVYLGMLGGSDLVPDNWKSRFFTRYQEALRYNDIYKQSEAVALAVLNSKAVPVYVLESSDILQCYEIPETADLSPLRLLFQDEAAFRAGRGYLIDLGYETDQYYPAFGEHMKGPDGFQIEVYYHLPFLTRTYDKWMHVLLKRTNPDPYFRNIRVFSLEDSYIFRMAEMAYRYSSDALLLRGVLDSFRYQASVRKELNPRVTELWLKRLQVDEIVNVLLKLGALWFGPRKGGAARRLRDTMALYDETENRILTNSQTGEERIGQAAVLREQILHAAETGNLEQEHRRRLDRIRGMFDGIAKRMKQEKIAESRDTGEREEIEASGRISYSHGNQGTIIRTPYFMVTVPEFWMGRLSVSCSPFREDYSESILPPARRNPDLYSVTFSFMKDEKARARIPLMRLTLFSDIDNAADKISGGGRYYYMDGISYYMGSLIHRESGRSYLCHVVGESFEDVGEMGQDRRIVTNMQDSVPDVLTSITPVHETLSDAERERGIDNIYFPFRDWQYGDMPQEYYYGNENTGQNEVRKQPEPGNQTDRRGAGDADSGVADTGHTGAQRGTGKVL